MDACSSDRNVDRPLDEKWSFTKLKHFIKLMNLYTNVTFDQGSYTLTFLTSLSAVSLYFIIFNCLLHESQYGRKILILLLECIKILDLVVKK
jgi:hypothetical protein